MSRKLKVLFAGEAIYVLTSIFKGRDTIEIGKYAEHGRFFLGAMKDNGIECDYIPTNKVMEEFPWTLEELKKYDAIAVSDVGSDTFLVSERTMNGERTPNRLKLIEQYVNEGGSYLMWGGYISFTGLYGKGFYKNTPIEKILPVEMLQTDDRVEVPEGFLPKIIVKNHPILQGIPEKWEGWFLSYNRLIPKKNATVIGVIEEHNNDPFLVVGEYGKGRTMASAVDCAHHGAAPSFLNWEYRSKLYGNMVKWLCKEI
ncbi:MAG: glutamine amidotransferase [Spirochaetales bacterium]